VFTDHLGFHIPLRVFLLRDALGSCEGGPGPVDNQELDSGVQKGGGTRPLLECLEQSHLWSRSLVSLKVLSESKKILKTGVKKALCYLKKI
jgi:hypothetical protein